MSKHNTPALRFEGFDGEWVSTTFGETAQLSRGLTYSPRDVVNANEGVRVYRSSNIQNLSVVTSPDDVWVNPKAVNIPFLTEGNILITASNGSVRLVGKSGIVKKLSAPGVPGGFMLKCVSALPTFTAGLLQSPWYKDFLNVHVAGGNGAIGNLDSKRLSDEMVSLPSTSEEQRAIGELFADLDDLIEQHRAKHANLQQTKTALLQRMFPQDGADEPELRLGGFSGAWETKKVDEICPLQRGFDLPASKMVEGPVPVVTSNGVARRHNKALVKGPGVTTGRSGTIGKVHFVEQDYWPHNTALWVTDFKGNDPRFVYHLLQHIDPSRFSSGSGVPTLNRNDLHDFVTSIPPALEEQRAIGEVFTNLDALIAAETRYITQLTQAKTALLQRMFV